MFTETIVSRILFIANCYLGLNQRKINVRKIFDRYEFEIAVSVGGERRVIFIYNSFAFTFF